MLGKGNARKANNEMSRRFATNNTLSSETQQENSGNDPSKTIKDNDSIENVVWKQMGTAKGAGKLHMGGKWLKNVEVIQKSNVFDLSYFSLTEKYLLKLTFMYI